MVCRSQGIGTCAARSDDSPAASHRTGDIEADVSIG